MSRSDNVYQLPANLPIPVDDGVCSHLTGLRLPSVALIATSGRTVNLGSVGGQVVVYCYPRTGQPDADPPPGWNGIPGARGCTPEACAFRDHHRELQNLGAQVFGLSTQDTDYQREANARLHLPLELLSDSDLEFANAPVACVVFGVLPALHLSRANQVQAIASRSGGARRREASMRSVLVVGQLVMATVLLVGAGLLINSFVKLTTVEKGYDASNVLALQLVLPGDYAIARKAETIDALLARLRATTGNYGTSCSD